MTEIPNDQPKVIRRRGTREYYLLLQGEEIPKNFNVVTMIQFRGDRYYVQVYLDGKLNPKLLSLRKWKGYDNSRY